MAQHIITKPTIQKEIAFYSFPHITKGIAEAFTSNMERHRAILRSLKVRGVMLSLADVMELDMEALQIIAKRLSVLQRELMVVSGICNYPTKIYPELQQMCQSISICLFYNLEIATLGVGTISKPPGTMIVLFNTDDEELNLTFSLLTSRRFFVIRSQNQRDFLTKAKENKNSAVLVNYSNFGTLHDDISVQFKFGLFMYSVRGILTEALFDKFNLKKHISRLESGHRVFVFNLEKMTTMDLRAAHFFAQIVQVTAKYEGRICFIRYSEDKIIPSALRTLKDCNIWNYDDLDEVLADPGIKHLLDDKKISTPSGDGKKGLTSELVLRLRHILTGTLETLRTYGKGDIQKGKVEPVKFDTILSYPSIAITAATFEGDIEGTLVFLFNRPIASAILEGMLGEQIDKMTKDEAADAMGEFVNTVAGAVKTALTRSSTSANFSIPMKIDDKQALRDIFGDKWGVHMNLVMDKQAFHVFLSPVTLGQQFTEDLIQVA